MSLGGCKLSMCILIISFQVNWSQDSEIKHLHPPRFREQGGYTLGFSYLVKNIFAFPFWIMFSSMLKDWGGGWKTSKTPIDCRERKGSSLLPPPPLLDFSFKLLPKCFSPPFDHSSTQDTPSPTPWVIQGSEQIESGIFHRQSGRAGWALLAPGKITWWGSAPLQDHPVSGTSM